MAGQSTIPKSAVAEHHLLQPANAAQHEHEHESSWHGCRAGERFGRAAGQRSAAADRSAENCAAAPHHIFANFAGTLTVDGIGVLPAATGMLNTIFAALIHVTSELAFILSSAQLLPAPGSAQEKEAHAHI